MAIAVYWKYSNYKSDTENGFAFHFNSNQERLHKATEIGDHVFAVSGFRTRSGFDVYLLADLIVKDKTMNPQGYKYGNYRIWADESGSRYFDSKDKPLTPVLTKLDSIKHFPDIQREKYAQAFQTIRELRKHDSVIILEFAKTLPVHPKTYYRFPEKEYEESIGNKLSVEALIKNQDISSDSKANYLKKITRNQDFKKKLDEMYVGKCQICAFDPITIHSKSLCISHHIIYISRGGEDSLENLVLLCPNCHEAVHKTNATFDYTNLAYKFPNGRILPLILNYHLNKAVE